MLKDNFNKFCLAVIALLVLLSLLFTIRASAEEYTAPEDAAGSSQDVPAVEEHPVTQVQGVQTYDPTLYDTVTRKHLMSAAVMKIIISCCAGSSQRALA